MASRLNSPELYSSARARSLAVVGDLETAVLHKLAVRAPDKAIKSLSEALKLVIKAQASLTIPTMPIMELNEALSLAG
jgi:hypothetical protein